ncbi:MAG: AMP-binding protein [Acidimicrobiales bacterium]
MNWRLVADELSVHPHRLRGDDARLRHGVQRRGGGPPLPRHRRHPGRQLGPRGRCRRPAEFAVGYEDVLARASPTSRRSVPPTTTCCSSCTSGTTGLPKGVMHTHLTGLWSVLTANTTADTRYGDRYLICLPLFHVGALNPLLSIIHKGGTGVIASEFDP